MVKPCHLLILGGTSEAVQLAEIVSERFGATVRLTTSLAGRTKAPTQPQGGVRVGAFGGVDGMRRWLRDAQVSAVVDATHPFAAVISENASSACRSASVPFLRLDRPPWKRQEGDFWHDAKDVASAASLLPRLGRRAFVTVGVQEIGAFADLPNIYLLARVIEKPVVAIGGRNLEFVAGRGPFTLEDEIEIINNYKIDTLVSKNSGGSATVAKIIAAREMSIPVIMIQRPSCEYSPSVSNVRSAVRWIECELDKIK